MNELPGRKPLFERVKAGLEDGIAFARGELKLQTTVLPEAPPPLRAQDVVRLRLRFKASQEVFARTLNVSTKTLQSWEQGSRRPSSSALRLLQLLAERPDVFDDLVGSRLGERAKVPTPANGRS